MSDDDQVYQSRQDDLEDSVVEGTTEVFQVGVELKEADDTSKPDILSAVWNLANYIVGAGVLAMPFACVKAGLIMALFLIVFVCIGVYLSFQLILWSSEASQRYTYEELAKYSVGERFANFVKILIIVDNLGPLAVYMNIVGEALSLFLKQFIANPNSLWVNKIWLTFLQLVCIVVPMCFIKDISKLGFTSFISLLPLAYIMLLQMISLARNGVSEGITMFAPDVFVALPIVVFAFACQQVMPPIYKEMREKGGGVADINKAVRAALTLSLISYVWVGFFGYLEYGEVAEDNILGNFPQNAASNVLWLSMAVSILLSYPVIVFPCRISVDRLLFPSRPYSYRRFVLENLSIVSLAFCIAVLIPQLSTLLGVFGALTSTFIGYVLPPLYYLRVTDKPWKEDRRSKIAWAVLVIGSLAGFTSFIAVIMETL
eukprot:gb/GEZN01005856.1/.p1 GENE.gb/GEZN01005856.1/~~gb/GEZN01005856.1/.p1  ORF type:complete len:429 (+),score=47.30 gb/GEZN01005856.1/:24-1310(+)